MGLREAAVTMLTIRTHDPWFGTSRGILVFGGMIGSKARRSSGSCTALFTRPCKMSPSILQSRFDDSLSALHPLPYLRHLQASQI